jgi:hypothetical protein
MQDSSPIRLYWPAIAVATVASFFFEAVWFTVFMNPWLKGIGYTHTTYFAQLQTQHLVTPNMQYLTALLCSIVASIVLTILIQKTGPQTALRGVKIAALVWLGFVATSFAKNYVFELRTLSIYLINTVYLLFDLCLLGAILGAWKSKKT